MDTLVRRDRATGSVRGAWAGIRSSGLRAVLALVLLAAAGIGAWLYVGAAEPAALNGPMLGGTWQLFTVDREPTGERSSYGVISQRMALRAGKVRGETIIRASSDAGSVAMPFPDESVDRVIPNADETGFRVLWSGTYEVDSSRQVTLHIGKAVYFVKLTLSADRQAIEFNQDVILTAHGAAVYRRAGTTGPP